MAGEENELLDGDEGMWVVNAIPFKRIEARYGIRLPNTFGKDVMHAAVRMNNGGSASFVSSDGLIMTNHHVGFNLIEDLSTESSDLIKNGFYAKKKEDELRVPHLEVNILDGVDDVTERVTRYEPGTARNKEIAAIEAESKEKTGLRSDVVSLYQGGRYHLYRYKKYTDVRLVFAPEEGIASFGGDFDNYEYPRYCLDVAFFRVYEDGRPLTPRAHLTLSRTPVSENELLFVAGHPGRTDRLTTYAAIQDIRDRALPYRLASLRRMEVNLEQYAGRSPEARRRAGKHLATVRNLRKRYLGQLEALHDPAFTERIRSHEVHLQKEVAAQAALSARIGNPWADIAEALTTLKTFHTDYDLFEIMIGFGGHYDAPHPLKSNWSTYLGIARTIIRMSEEDEKQSGDRLPEFTDAKRESLLERLYAPSPIYDDLEISMLKDALSLLREMYGRKDALVNEILENKTPSARARELVLGTRLADPEMRKALVRGGKQAIAKSTDPMILLARLIDERARALRMQFDNEVRAIFESAYGRIAEAAFSVHGENLYPDATFTLRLAYGTVKAYEYEEDQWPASTRISDILEHAKKHGCLPPWELPPSWKRKEEWVRESHTPFNFISTHDSHGGNSGSPVFTKEFKCVGVLFDGIQAGQGSTFRYGDYERAISVSAAGILDILEHIYNADSLVKELTQ